SLNVTRALLFSRHVTATAATYTLSLHDALPILRSRRAGHSTPLGAHGQGIDPHRRAALLHAPHAQGVRRADVPAGLRERRGPEVTVRPLRDRAGWHRARASATP